ncbi:tonB protein [Pseudomonas savastanoi pv. glycinea str. race 4]|uniref:TonB protein n=1 Tax=Pseudomonas savastanoi pv. glycinea str. race 4 TaxID=875330 RepID=F3C4J8_PSESG|nr:tonB protein [Pseudomonas savastanoi pv. glycinea str. race 4]
MNTLALDYHPPRREWVNGPWLRSNGLAVAVALALHGVLLGGLMFGWSPPRSTARTEQNPDHAISDFAASA